MIKPRILVVDDEEDLIKIVKTILEKEGFNVSPAQDATQAYEKIEKTKPDLIILDLNLPGEDGYQLCHKLKDDPRYKDVPIIILSTRDTEFDKVLGLELGAEDYITKPFGTRELIARVKVALRRRQGIGSTPAIFKSGKIYINLDKRTVNIQNKEISLTPKEFDLLYLLVKNKGKVLNRSYLTLNICGYEYYGTTRTIDMHIKQLRSKLGKYGKNIVTVEGIGYMYEDKK